MLKEIIKSVLPVVIQNELRTRVIRPTRKGLALMRVKMSMPPKKKLKKIQFEVYLAEHCNLNCAGCSHFSPLADPEFIDVEKYQKDVERLGELFHHECRWIHLMGGEPLLHPQIIPLIKLTRENFSGGGG